MIKRFGASMLLLAALSGCAGTSTTEPAVIPTQQTEPTATTSPTATALPIPDDVAGSFREIADASCATASTEGVTEIATDGSGRLILVPKEDAYQDFSAVSVGESGVGELIWSTEVFSACNASIGFSYSDESNSEYGTDQAGTSRKNDEPGVHHHGWNISAVNRLHEKRNREVGRGR